MDDLLSGTPSSYSYHQALPRRQRKPRGNWTRETDLGLLNGASAYALRNNWRERIRITPPAKCESKVVIGEIASGEKVIDDPTNDFFDAVLKR
jgi:hypothetical protein